MLVEQAIFASARSGRAEGYHLIEHSPGLSESDARELSQWGPTHDSLASAEPQAASYNFFPLESGAYCVSKTSAAGAEYSGRGGAQVQTWCLVVPVQVLSRLANNPFAVCALPRGASCRPGILRRRWSPVPAWPHCDWWAALRRSTTCCWPN